MNVIKEEWKEHSYGACDYEVCGRGWYQRQKSADRIEIDVNLMQQQWLGGVFFKRANLTAIVDTGSPYTIISREQFEKAGFRIPATPITNLNITGVVRRSKTEIRDDEVLWGWRDVPLNAYPFTLCYKI